MSIMFELASEFAFDCYGKADGAGDASCYLSS